MCVNENIFLQYVLEYNFDRISFNPTKKWKIRNNNLGLKELFMENIKNQDKVAKKESDDYRHDEIRKIGPHLKHEKLNDLSLSNKYEILFDLNEPKLKFVLKDEKNLNTQDKYHQLLISMMNISLVNNFFNEGCHICLDLSNDENLIEGHIRLVIYLIKLII